MNSLSGRRLGGVLPELPYGAVPVATAPLVDEYSVNVASAATVILLAGTGKKDRQTVANADWQIWAADVQKTTARYPYYPKENLV